MRVRPGFPVSYALRMMKRLAAVAAALMIGTVGVLVGAAPAQANFAWCPANKVCLSSDTNGNGTKLSYFTTEMRGGAAFPSKYRYIMDSVYNRTGSDILLYDNPGCWKGRIRISAHSATNLGVFPHGGDFGGWSNKPASISSDGTAPPLGIGNCGD